jgi:hypothetical protein
MGSLVHAILPLTAPALTVVPSVALPHPIPSCYFGLAPKIYIMNNPPPLTYAEPGDWADRKAIIARLYVDENKPLKEVMRIMRDDFQFRAT